MREDKDYQLLMGVLMEGLSPTDTYEKEEAQEILNSLCRKARRGCLCPDGNSDLYVAHHRKVCLVQEATLLDEAAELIFRTLLLTHNSAMEYSTGLNKDNYCPHGYEGGESSRGVRCFTCQAVDWTHRYKKETDSA